MKFLTHTHFLCYLRWLQQSGSLCKLRKKSSALQSEGCYMKCFQICMWNLSSSLHFPRPLMKNYKSASYPWLWNQRKVLNKFNICALMLSCSIYTAKKKKSFRSNRVKLKSGQTSIEIIANTAIEWQWRAYNSSTSSEDLSGIYFLWHSEEDKHLNTQEVLALSDKSALCSYHKCSLDPAQKPAKRDFSLCSTWPKVEHSALGGNWQKVHRGSKLHWLKW